MRDIWAVRSTDPPDELVDDAATAVRGVVPLQRERQDEKADNNEDDVAGDEVRRLDDEASRQRELRAEGRETFHDTIVVEENKTVTERASLKKTK